MPRLRYPNQRDVAVVRQLLAVRFFPEYAEDSPPPLFGVIRGREGEAALDSALNVIRQPYYRRLHDKAGALLRSMIKNHPFVDGNKRIALVTTHNFLGMNGQVLILATSAEMIETALNIAKSEPDTPWQDVAAWTKRHCVSQSISRKEFAARLGGRPTEVVAELYVRARYIAKLYTDAVKRLGLPST